MAQRSLKVKCPTWDHVEAFYSRKLRNGNTLSIKVPFQPQRGEKMVLALRLPNEMVMAIDASVTAVKLLEKGAAIQLLLHGMSAEVLARLEMLVADSRTGHDIADEASVAEPLPPPPAAGPSGRATTVPPPPTPSDAPIDELVAPPLEVTPAQLGEQERSVFVQLDAALRRLRESGAHEVLGVAWDAGVPEIRAAYFSLTKRFHPDIFAMYRSRAIQHMAQEVFIHINRAYDRMRDAAVLAGKAIVAGPALLPHQGWMAEFDDIGTDPIGATPGFDIAQGTGSEPVVSTPAASPSLGVSFSNAPEPEPEPEPVVRFAPATPESLFGDEPSAPVHKPSSDPSLALERLQGGLEDKVQRTHGLEDQAHEKLEAEDWEGAADCLAQALQLDPRNRRLRGLYHVSRGRSLMAEGKTAQATAQFEAALAHDPNCEAARAAVEDLQKKNPKKSGIFKRFFR